MPGRNEGQLAREIAHGRPRQAFNEGLTVVALREFGRDQKMAGSPESIFEWLVPHHLDRFDVQARPGRRTTPDDLGRRVAYNRARFKMRMQPRRRVIFGDRRRGRCHKRRGLIQGHLGGTGHCSILFAAWSPFKPNDVPALWLLGRSAGCGVSSLLGWVCMAVATATNTRRLPLSRRVE